MYEEFKLGADLVVVVDLSRRKYELPAFKINLS